MIDCNALSKELYAPQLHVATIGHVRPLGQTQFASFSQEDRVGNAQVHTHDLKNT